ncbi:MAG: Kelch repeat-containing protein [Alphaproteobacteria bacterium]
MSPFRPVGRRALLGGLAATFAGTAFAQHAHHDPLLSHLRHADPVAMPPEAEAQRFIQPTAPTAADPGRWVTRAPLPLPRSEMAWATQWNDRMHIVGGYGLQRVDRPYHHIYDPAADAWREGPVLPRGANHVGVIADAGRIYACGGFIEQNRAPFSACYALTLGEDSWREIAPFPTPRGAVAIVALGGLIHSIGGRDVRSIDSHDVYDPRTDRWSRRAPIPGPRDHAGPVVIDGRIHVVGGRMDTFHFNTGLHVLYDPAADRWEERAPMPTPRSGHGAVLYRGRIFCMGGEGTRRVFGQNEGYDPAADRWATYAPMPTPRHGLGAAVVGGMIHVAGGGPVMGGMIQTAYHEAFALDA